MTDAPGLSPDHDSDDPEEALRSARARFISGFPQRIDALRAQVAAIVDTTTPDSAEADALGQSAHKLAGLAGMVGLPTVTEHAATLESIAGTLPFDGARAQATIDSIGESFTRDVAVPPAWALPQGVSSDAKVLVIEDDADQRAIITALLKTAGFRVTELAAGTQDTIAATRRLQPDAILLDVDLPGIDGYTLCRRFKSDPALASVPVMFLTSRVQPLERTAGLTLGADDYLAKPYDPGEFVVRLGRLASRRVAAAHARSSATSAVLSYEQFVAAATDLLRNVAGAFALLRATPAVDPIAKELVDELRRKDLVGRYSDSHLVVLLPELTAIAAADRLDAIITRLRVPYGNDIAAGISGSIEPGGDVAKLLADADYALASARVWGAAVALAGERQPANAPPSRRVLIAEDDPEVVHIIDPRLRAAGFTTSIAFDGQNALQAVAREAPDVMLLDLMMPKLTGFDVLARLRELPPPRPRVIVISAKGREHDVTRAFDLGADDYVTKPFSPQELTARVLRLFR